MITFDPNLPVLKAYRNPTRAEIRFGYGATHWKNLPRILFTKPDGSLKQWTVCPIDGLRYYRSGYPC